MREEIERLLRFNCPASCDGQGTYVEDDGLGNPEPAQCQWCYEFGMPARTAIEKSIKDAVIYGWEASAEGYNSEYPGLNEESQDKLAEGYLRFLNGEERLYGERY